MNKLFTENFLSHYLNDFSISNVVGIRDKAILISSLLNELDSGKLESLKEEEFKSRFISNIFGDILGFNYGNSNEWLLREEVKTKLDGTKPDGALGFFYSNKNKDVTRAVIEIKDFNTELDKKQKRANNQTPVEQAFSYSPKMGCNCKWVIISNIQEIRFYLASDMTKYQAYQLDELTEDKKLKEFLYLFHKDRFMKKDTIEKSHLEKLLDKQNLSLNEKKDFPIHIIDEIHYCLKRFDGLSFVDPNYIASIYPFNILNEYVWHYNDYNLFTLNPKIFSLLKEINIQNGDIIFSDLLKKEIEIEKVINAKEKLLYCFERLNYSLINKITAIKDYKVLECLNKKVLGFSLRHNFRFGENDGITKDIFIVNKKACDCLSCNYLNFDFEKILRKLKIANGDNMSNTTEYAYGNFLVCSNDYKTAYNIFKSIEKETKDKENNHIEYFLSKMNIKYMHNLIEYHYSYDDMGKILNNIKSIDLDKVIYDEIEFYVDKEVKNYLIKIKEEDFIYQIQDEIIEIVTQIEKLKLLYDKKGSIQHFGFFLPKKLYYLFYSLHSHIYRNKIIYKVFRRYESLNEKVFRGFLLSHQTQAKEWRFEKFDIFLLSQFILNISNQNFKEIIKNVDTIEVNDGCVEELLVKLNNIISGYYQKGVFNGINKNELLSEYLENYSFRDIYTRIFTNTFLILSKINITENQIQSINKSLKDFLKVETHLYWYNLEALGLFFLNKGNLYSFIELSEFLKIAIIGDKSGNTKYTEFIKQITYSINKFYPEEKFGNVKLIKTIILEYSDDEGVFKYGANHLIPLIRICTSECISILENAFEELLSRKFEKCAYEELLENGYDYKKKDFFEKYTNQINHSRNELHLWGNYQLTYTSFIRYVYFVYKLNIDFDTINKSWFTKMNDFENWILDPYNYDYSRFNANWLIDLNYDIYLTKFSDIEDIQEKIEDELNKVYNPILAEIKYKLLGYKKNQIEI